MTFCLPAESGPQRSIAREFFELSWMRPPAANVGLSLICASSWKREARSFHVKYAYLNLQVGLANPVPERLR